MEEIQFDQVDFASAGAIGEPGNRTFMIQGFKGNDKAAVLVEKQQIEMLSDQSIEFLDSLSDEFPEEELATPYEFDKAAQVYEIPPMFRARSMGLLFDPDTLMVTLELRENPLDENNELIDEYGQEERVVKLTMTRSQLRAMAVKGHEAVIAGREICLLCQGPMELSGHVCPRLN